MKARSASISNFIFLLIVFVHIEKFVLLIFDAPCPLVALREQNMSLTDEELCKCDVYHAHRRLELSIKSRLCPKSLCATVFVSPVR